MSSILIFIMIVFTAILVLAGIIDMILQFIRDDKKESLKRQINHQIAKYGEADEELIKEYESLK